MNVVSGMSISFSSFEHHESCNYIANYHNENLLVAVPQEVGLILALFVLLALFAEGAAVVVGPRLCFRQIHH